MELITDAYVRTEWFSGHWIWVVPLAILLISVIAATANKMNGDDIMGAGGAFAAAALFLTAILWLITTDSFHDDILKSDLHDLGIEKVVLEEYSEGEEFVGEMDGKFVECGLLDTGDIRKYKVICD